MEMKLENKIETQKRL